MTISMYICAKLMIEYSCLYVFLQNKTKKTKLKIDGINKNYIN